MKRIFQTPCGNLLLEVKNQRLCRCSWCQAETYTQDANVGYSPDDELVMLEAIRQLDEYFKSERRTFNLPLDVSGTPFLTAVWREIAAIPYGETVSYKEISDRIGRLNAQRAVAMACSRNRFCIIIPCHRVTTSRGGVGGYTAVTTGCKRGSNSVGISIKQYLLRHESASGWQVQGSTKK